MKNTALILLTIFLSSCVYTQKNLDSTENIARETAIHEYAIFAAKSDFSTIGERYYVNMFSGELENILRPYRAELYGDMVPHRMPVTVSKDDSIYMNSYNTRMCQLSGSFNNEQQMFDHYNNMLDLCLQNHPELEREIREKGPFIPQDP